MINCASIQIDFQNYIPHNLTGLNETEDLAKEENWQHCETTSGMLIVSV